MTNRETLKFLLVLMLLVAFPCTVSAACPSSMEGSNTAETVCPKWVPMVDNLNRGYPSSIGSFLLSEKKELENGPAGDR